MAAINKLNFAEEAERVIESMRVENRQGEKKLKLTTSKIRNMLTMTNNLYNELLKKTNEELSDDTAGNIQYLKMKFAYEAGRDAEVKKFVTKAKLMENIAAIGRSRKKALLFCKYMESLVAYHKFYGGKDRNR